MILLRVAHVDQKCIEEIAEFLLRERLAIDINIEKEVERMVLRDDQIVQERICILTATTKSLLFTIIDVRLCEMYPKEVMEIYGVPIVHMDFAQRRHLLDEVKEV
ncbi:MAG: divalent cation tolerance protein CutA [Saprospiraceae bacterium]|nr:divalent cation tolerance protein CutA [Saprospiraceae bacterium]